MYEATLFFTTERVSKDTPIFADIKKLLASVDLDIDSGVHDFVIGKIENNVVACAGIDHNVVKCVAVDHRYQGLNITLTLIENVLQFAYEKGQPHLFLYTKPSNIDVFMDCGFYPLVEVPDTIVLMENTPVGISRYCQTLAAHRKSGQCGAIVMNANPFTRGHLYLAEYAAKEVDWLYIFLVSENASLFPADVRYQLVKEGVSHLSNVTVFPGSEYIVSKATFPTYFLKEETLIEQSYMAIDLLLFRKYIAPTLSIHRRYVGTEPLSIITNAYNQAMMHWLKDEQIADEPMIDVIEIPRITFSDEAISASRVRALLSQKKYQEIKQLVPPPTWSYITQHYHFT